MRFHSFPFSFLTDFDFIFCWSSKNPWDRSGGILVFKVVFLFSAFPNFSGPEINFHGGSNIRVLEARGLAGLAGFAGLAGLARLARLARLAGVAGVAGRRIGTTKSNTLDAQERSAD